MDGEALGEDLLRYWANHSSTYDSNHEDKEFIYGTNGFRGEIGLDTFRIAGLEIVNQPFLNADSTWPLGFISFYFGYDGVLGLAPRWNTSVDDTALPSPWSSMVNRSVLDRNLFAIDVPRGPRDVFEIGRTGQISFGDIDPKYELRTFTKLPVSTYTDQVWATEAQWLRLENATHWLEEDFVNFTLAGFDTTAWYLGLPGKWSSEIYASIEHECGFIWCFVDCHQRASMPNITFGLSGHDFTLTPYDYAPELVANGQSFCSFEIYNTDDEFPVPAIVLGTQFLNAYYSVFDLDNMEIRLTNGIE